VLIDRFGVSERHACRVVGQHRATQRTAPAVPPDDEMALRAWLRAFALSRPRWGWRRAAVIARGEGWRVNSKRIQRLWRAEGLKVPYRKRKKPLRGHGVVMGAMCPIRPNVLWVSTFALSRSPTFKLSTTGPRPFFLLHRTSSRPLTPADELCDLTGQMVG
jgi:putative transposase